MVYLLEGYKYPTNKWMEINGNKYYFDTNGYMLEDTLVRVDEQVYYVDKNGKLCFTDSTGALKQKFLVNIPIYIYHLICYYGIVMQD